MLLLYRLGENRFSVSDFPLLYSLYRWHVCFCIIHPSASYTAEKTLLFPGTYWSNNCHAGLKFPHSSYFLFYMFSKVYLKTKKMTDISQTQAGFCVCRNRRYFRRFRYTLIIQRMKVIRWAAHRVNGIGRTMRPCKNFFDSLKLRYFLYFICSGLCWSCSEQGR